MTEVKTEKNIMSTKVFGVRVNPSILLQSVRVFMSNQRSSKAKSKTRGEISKTTAKMYKQKGTGRARHGAYSAPIFVGGGVSHGPTGTQNYKLGMSKKLNKLAILGALTQKAKAKEVIFVSGIEKGKTKDALAIAEKNDFMTGKRLVVVGEKEQGTARAWKNIAGINIARSNSLNAYTVLVNSKIAITKTALAELEKKYVA
jgi:large subunit ribosomal protein L4